ncbi:hypothetical protein CRUP_018484 [Coryphaenoides rupestris]|nr:hypothetical protein CRUP_018484 [Coryphaenoides rupestris]
MADEAFVTLATNDSYAKGAMVLGQSLRKHKTTKKLVILIGPHVAEPCRSVLESLYDEVRVVDVMESGDTAHLALMKRPDLGVTFTKLHCWTLTHYSKCVLSNIDELFERDELSAAPDPGWPDCFNSGVVCVRCHARETAGVLQRERQLRWYGHEAKVVHFLGKLKPWSYSYNAQSGEVKGHHSLAPGLCQVQPDYLRLWWELYSGAVLPALLKAYGDTPFNTGCVDDGKSHGDELSETSTAHGSGSSSSSSAPPAPPALKVSSDERKKRWEAGQADYMGDDSFVHIERKLDSFLK